MSKKSTKALASATLMSLVLTTALSAGPVQAAAGKVTRTSGSDRYATAASVATANWTTSDDVVLVSGEGYADAVSASALAKKLNAPILLTTAGSLSTDTQNALTTLKAKNIYVVGGNASVSSSVRSDLKKNYNLIELGGANRYETNAAVAQKLVDLGVKPDEVIMVGGEGFSDALSIAPIAAAKGQILLLGVNNADSMKSVIDFVNKNGSKVTVVGTENVINSDIYSKVKGTNRVSGGADRFDTNMKVLAAYKDTVKMDKLYVANATGDGYADALVASAVAGKTGSPLVLVDTDGATATSNAIKYVSNNKIDKTEITIIGGTGVVSQNIEDQLNGGKPSPVKDATVKSVEVMSLNEIKVTFGENIDEDSAENVENYKLDGVQLKGTTGDDEAIDENSAVAHADGDHVIITLAHPRKAYNKATFTVKKNVLTEDKDSTIAENTQDLVFKDSELPTLKSVEAEGNNQLTVEFSEVVNMKTISALKDKFKIDGKSISNFGVNTEYSEIKDKLVVNKDSAGPAATWSSKVIFYFDSRLDSGDHKLKISTGDSNSGSSIGLLSDAVPLPFQETEKTFTVGSMSTAPEPTKIEETKSGEVHITFDRPMDIKTVKQKSNFKINNTQLSDIDGATIKTDDNDKLIKLKHVGSAINTGSNTLYISDDVKDAFGNNVPKDTTKSFEDKKDETKPTVLSVNATDGETIHVRFSKDVQWSFATNKSNYVLKDDKGTDITDHIAGIYNITSDSDKDDASDFNIKITKTNPDNPNDDWRLTNTKYTLTIKNIRDTASTPNIMDEKTFDITDVADNIAPTGVGTYKKDKGTGDKDSVVIYFSEAMDTTLLSDRSNYKYIDGEGNDKVLPSEADVRAGSDGKSAIIEFPSSYHVVTTGKTTTGSANDVTSVVVFNVKDKAGNELATKSFDNHGKIDIAQAGAQVKEKTVRTQYAKDGDPNEGEFWILVQFDRAVDTVDKNDFKFGGVVASSTSLVGGDTVKFIFDKNDKATAADLANAAALNSASNIITKDGIAYGNGKVNNAPTKIELVKAQGNNLKLAINASSGSIDESGARLSVDKDGKPVDLKDTQAKVYNNYANPRTTAYDKNTTDPGYWTATKDGDTGKVYVTFDSALDTGVANTTDFKFAGLNGTELKPSSAEVDKTHPNTVIFNFTKEGTKDFSAFTGTIQVNSESTTSFQAQADLNGDKSKFKPSRYDTDQKNVTVVENKVDVTGVTLNKTTTSIAPNATETLTATVTPDNASNKTVAWTSSDTAVATVDSTGKVTALKNGTTTITATAGTKTATCVVTVSDTPAVDWATAPKYNGITSTINGKVDPAKVSSVKAVDSTGTSVTATMNADGTFSIATDSLTAGYVAVTGYDTNGNVVVTAPKVIYSGL